MSNRGWCESHRWTVDGFTDTELNELFNHYDAKKKKSILWWQERIRNTNDWVNPLKPTDWCVGGDEGNYLVNGNFIPLKVSKVRHNKKMFELFSRSWDDCIAKGDNILVLRRENV